jgi:hypothetical protein
MLIGAVMVYRRTVQGQPYASWVKVQPLARQSRSRAISFPLYSQKDPPTSRPHPPVIRRTPSPSIVRWTVVVRGELVEPGHRLGARGLVERREAALHGG